MQNQSIANQSIWIQFNNRFRIINIKIKMNKTQKMKKVKQTLISIECKGQYNAMQRYVQIFNVKSLQTYNLVDTFEYNKDIFGSVHDRVYPDSLLELKFEEDDQKLLFIQDFYELTLDNHIKNKISSEQEALRIFQDVLKSVYSFSFESLPQRNIRPEHFAFVDGKWKLRSAVLNAQNYEYDGQYALNPKYQAPQEYANIQNGQLDLRKIIVWNLGSLLLDLLLGTHIPKDIKTINKWKDRQFTLQAINSKTKVSEQLRIHLGKMLHFNPGQRYSPEQIYQNPYFSKEIAEHYKINASVMSSNALSVSSIGKSSLGKSNRGLELKRSSLGKSIRNSNQQLKTSAIQIYNMVPIEEETDQIEGLMSRSQLLTSKKKIDPAESYNLEDEDDFFDKLNFITTFQKKQKKISTIIQEDSCFEDSHFQLINIQNDPDLRNIFSIYKTYIDRSQLLCISVKKFWQIPYESQFKEQLFLLNQFSVYYASLIELNKIVNALNSKKNIYKINDQKFHEFINTRNFKAYCEQINKRFRVKVSYFQIITQKLQEIPEKSRKLLKRSDILNYIDEQNFRENHFVDIKKPYRQILKMTYDIISNLYNVRKDQRFCRLSLYAVYCMTIDKLYIDNDLKDNFSQFIQWNTLNSTRRLEVSHQAYLTLSVSQLQKYFDIAPIKILIVHSKRILQKYYKI